MKVIMNEPSISLGVEAKSDSGNQQGKTEANKNTEIFQNAHESTVPDQSGSEKVIEANIPDREHGPKHERQESTNTGLLGSLKSFAYGIRNFLKNKL
uniref:Uncharacterized protein n=1 Tax=Arundo donax TaxID=35708 RepID=A0A0A9GK28_ARUDO